MRSMCSAAALAARLAVPAVLACFAPGAAQAQPHSTYPRAPFVGPAQSYALHGCGDGYLSGAFDAPRVTSVFCLDGTATLGLITNASGSAPDVSTYQLVLDLSGTRRHGFAGEFTDADYSVLVLDTRYAPATGDASTALEGFLLPVDPTGRRTEAFRLFTGPATGVQLGDVYDFGPTTGAAGGVAHLAYYAPGDRRENGPRGLDFSVSVTATPEPSAFALAFGGAVMLGGIAAARRRA